MAQVVIALGSNLNNPHQQLKKAAEFLEGLSEQPILTSSIYQSEPIGPSENDYLNGVIIIETNLYPDLLFARLKAQEQVQGRPSRYPKWTARTLDLDIIAYGSLVLQTDSLIIPHAEYSGRLFVLLPLRDVLPDWVDPISAQPISDMINSAAKMSITQTTLHW